MSISPGPSTLLKQNSRITSLGLTVEGQALVRTMVENGRLDLTMVKIDAWKGAIRYGAGGTTEIPNHKREHFWSGEYPGYDQHILDHLSDSTSKFSGGEAWVQDVAANLPKGCCGHSLPSNMGLVWFR